MAESSSHSGPDCRWWEGLLLLKLELQVIVYCGKRIAFKQTLQGVVGSLEKLQSKPTNTANRFDSLQKTSLISLKQGHISCGPKLKTCTAARKQKIQWFLNGRTPLEQRMGRQVPEPRRSPTLTLLNSCPASTRSELGEESGSVSCSRINLDPSCVQRTSRHVRVRSVKRSPRPSRAELNPISVGIRDTCPSPATFLQRLSLRGRLRCITAERRPSKERGNTGTYHLCNTSGMLCRNVASALGRIPPVPLCSALAPPNR